MPAFPKTEDLTKAREQANQVVGGAVEQARTPLLAVLGAGDLANQALVDVVTKVRSQLTERVESARKDLPNDIGELRQKADPVELRKRLDGYGQSARKYYTYLAKHGEETFQRLQETPQAKKVREGVDTAQGKVEETVGQVGGIADDVLGKVTSPFAKSEELAANSSADSTESESADSATTESAEAQGEEKAEGQAKSTTATKPAAAKSSTTTKSPAATKPAGAPKKSTTSKADS